MARFICGMTMHVALSSRINEGMNMMKYSLNHQWKFVHWTFAYLAGFMQTISAVCVELCNFVVIVTSIEIIDIVMNFMALVVISEFGQYFYSAYTEKELKAVIIDKKYENFLIIQTTTSFESRAKIPGNEVEPQSCETKPGEHQDMNKTQVPQYIRINFSDRKWYDKLLYLVYRLLRTLYVSFWFYFMPFLVIIASYVVPIIIH